ncbi:ABC transporter substrate-binding protein [Bifidobacterium aemilianum]|uniref:ABC transporter substrate-binding protein n=1 Tax=Bifidobacterium aemilianum TaxID=2493120 RepID=A0A366K6G8_9BIFI|nr:sugar ABC transporter substrate-binding protein [Bifidobacterium aemilianum]RBP97254.1 ABC transporter substrate-binding protein [Bifidobacterium aemilianum]
MRNRKWAAGIALTTAALMALSGCSMGGGKSSGEATGDTNGKGKTITVWAMKGDYQDETLATINKAFEKKTGAKVKLQIQQWDGIGTKVTTALSTDATPDIIDMGNTQVAGYAASGGLMDLTSEKGELADGKTWIKGLEDPATVDGKLYGVPAFAAARAVIYNKQIWKDAGVSEEPKNWDEFTADLDKVREANASNPDFVPFYMPGQYWYSALQFIWDAGGDVAKEEGGNWKGSVSSEKSVKGMEEWKDFENKYSSEASRSVDTETPSMDDMLADGKTGAILSNSATIGTVKKTNPSLTDDSLGTFAMPGKSGKNQVSMVAGSDWAVAQKSKNQKLAIEWLKIAASDEIQQTWVFEHDGWLPNSVQGLDKAMKSDKFPQVQKGFFEAAKNSKTTPASPNWADIEADKSVNDFTKTVATGSSSIKDAAQQFDAHMDEVFAKKN